MEIKLSNYLCWKKSMTLDSVFCGSMQTMHIGLTLKHQLIQCVWKFLSFTLVFEYNSKLTSTFMISSFVIALEVLSLRKDSRIGEKILESCSWKSAKCIFLFDNRRFIIDRVWGHSRSVLASNKTTVIGEASVIQFCYAPSFVFKIVFFPWLMKTISSH